MKFINKPIFIGGSMKSGTTLLRKLISDHPSIFGGLETHWFSSDFTDNWNYYNSKRQKWMLEFFDVKKKEYQDLVNSSSNSYDYFNNFMNHCAIRAGKVRWVEKTPGNIMQTGTILKYWPHAKILNSVRDSRDVYASWKKIGKENLSSFIDYMIQLIEPLGEDIGTVTENYSVVRYENLVQNTHGELRKVFDFINEEYFDEIGNFKGDDTVYKKVLKVTGKKSTTGISLTKPINNSGVNHYLEILTKEEIRIIEKELESYLDKFSYLK